MSDDAIPAPPVRPLVVLAVAVVVVVVLPRVPFVQLVLLPLTWLGTLAHETGHGLAALAIGGELDSIEVFMNGSGVAHASRPGHPAWLGAVVSVGGLVGPAVVSVGLLWMGLGPRLARAGLVLLGLALLAEAAVYTQGFATLVALGWGVVALGAGWKLPGQVARLGVLVVAVQLALQVYRGSDYLFVAEAHTSAGTLPSDVANVASALGGHYLLWGVAIGLLDIVLLGVGLAGFFFGDRVLAKLGR